MNGDGMLAWSCDSMGVGAIKLTMDHDMAGMECSAKEPSGKQVVIRYYGGALMYTNLYVHNTIERSTGGVMSVGVNEFQAYILHFYDDVKYSNRKSATFG